MSHKFTVKDYGLKIQNRDVLPGSVILTNVALPPDFKRFGEHEVMPQDDAELVVATPDDEGTTEETTKETTEETTEETVTAPTMPGSDGNADDIDALREEYQIASGKEADGRWGVEKLKEKIQEATA